MCEPKLLDCRIFLFWFLMSLDKLFQQHRRKKENKNTKPRVKKHKTQKNKIKMEYIDLFLAWVVCVRKG